MILSIIRRFTQLKILQGLMRKTFARLLFEEMKSREDIVVVTADLGYKMFDEIRRVFPDRYFNVGAAETAAVDIGVGLALSGKIPIVYSITPFLLRRAYESIFLYVNHEKIPVKLVGSGRDRDYEHDGITHWADDAKAILSNFENIQQAFPVHTLDLEWKFRAFLYEKTPWFLSLRR